MSTPRTSSSHGQRKQSVGRPSSRGTSNAANSQQQRKIVGQYMIGKTIGEGTFGKVKVAIHLPTGEKVAVKILEKNKIKEQADVRRVNREIKILKKAKHDNVIQLYEVLDTNSAIYLIMEHCDGGEMFEYIVSHRHVVEKQACKFFHQIMDGLEMLHANDITHRDLKPENLLLKATPGGWVVKIVDFGLSNTHENNRLLATACGSPCYAAPEMIAGKQYSGPMADMWSSGVILFALVCGCLPFEDPNTSALYRKILSGQYKPAKWISPEVSDLIRKILEVDPLKRYTIADVRKHPWYAAIPDSAIPKDVLVCTSAEASNTHTKILQSLQDGGVDIQAVQDGLASKTCNSFTAMYFLLEQKAKTKMLHQQQQQRQSQPQLKDSSATASKTSVVSSNSSTRHTDEVVANANAVIKANSAAAAPPVVIGGTTVADKVLANRRVPGATGGVALQPLHTPASSAPNAALVPNGAVVRKARPSQIPKLDLTAARQAPAVAAPYGAPTKPEHLVSQTARENVHHKAPSNDAANPLDQTHVSQTARGPNPNINIKPSHIPAPAAAPLFKSQMPNHVAPGDAQGGEERPTTRRSRLRSAAGSRNEAPDAGPGVGVIPDVPVADKGVESAAPAASAHQPHAPQQPQRSSVSNATGGGRRGKHVTVTSAAPTAETGSATAEVPGPTPASPTKTTNIIAAPGGETSFDPPRDANLVSASSNNNSSPRSMALRNKQASETSSLSPRKL